jgi:hypothetical protein
MNNKLNIMPKYMQAISAIEKLSGSGEVEIDLPMLRTSAIVRPIDGGDDMKMKTLRTSGATFIKNFNDLLMLHTSFNDIKFSNLKDFQEHLTPPDKSLLVYALLTSTFTKLPEKTINCPECEAPVAIDKMPSEMLHDDTFKKMDIDF